MLKKMYCLFYTLIVGCAGPKLINGRYFYTGDSEFRYYKVRDDTSINCYSSASDDTFTGYRNVMTDQQLQMHMHQERELNRQLENSRNRRKHTDCYQIGGMISCDSY
jgi:hypothetical protein